MANDLREFRINVPVNCVECVIRAARARFDIALNADGEAKRGFTPLVSRPLPLDKMARVEVRAFLCGVIHANTANMVQHHLKTVSEFF